MKKIDYIDMKLCYNTPMPNAFTTIYTLLNRLEKFLDCDCVDISQIDNEALKISENRWRSYILMLNEAGYIDGVIIKDFIDGNRDINIDDISITLKGLEYISQNSMMIKAYKTIKGIREILP